MISTLRRTWVEINLDHLAYNYEAIRAKTETKILGVVKADAYGHGAVRVAKKLEKLGASYLAVSSLDEARELRSGEIDMPILILGHTPPEMVPELIDLHITQTVSAYAKAREYSAAAQKCGGSLKVHIKVDTGMSRLGFLVRGEHFDGGVDAIAASCALPGLEAEGIFTHFATADMDGKENEGYTCEQFSIFEQVIAKLKERGVSFALRHCANSGAIARYPQMYLDMVRPGIILYGCGDDAQAMHLKPVMSLKTTVSTIKVFDKDTSISYGRTYCTSEKTRVAVLPIGYADGLFRALSGKMQVFTPYGTAPQVGRICMDMCMVDISKYPDVDVGDEIEIFGEHIACDTDAKLCDTISYELLCDVSKRVPRIYYENNQRVDYNLQLLG